MDADLHRTPLVNISPAWRYSLKQLLLATAIIALGCVALRNASSMWVAAMFGMTLIVLAGASLCAVFRSGQHRAFWIGFAACGWLYVLVLMYGWSLDPNNLGMINPLSPHRLATTQTTNWFHGKLFPITTQQMMVNTAVGGFIPAPPGATVVGYDATGRGPFGGPTGPTTVHLRYGPDPSEFANVAHALWTLLFALCGGWFARWLYVSGPGRTGVLVNPEPEATANSSNERSPSARG